MIWCLGMYASGSTWLFNATRQAVVAAAPGVEVTACYAETLKMLGPVRAGGGIKIVKTHQLDAAAAKFMSERATAILLTIRDPRDAVVSLIQHMGHGLRTALSVVETSALFCERFAADPRTQLLKYEGGYIDDPATFDRLAATAGGRLSADQRNRLFALTRRAVIEAKIAGLETLPTTVSDPRSGDVVDLDTQWHRHHANRSGEVGRWQRLLSPQAIKMIEQRMQSWMQRFGYLEHDQQPVTAGQASSAP